MAISSDLTSGKGKAGLVRGDAACSECDRSRTRSATCQDEVHFASSARLFASRPFKPGSDDRVLPMRVYCAGTSVRKTSSCRCFPHRNTNAIEDGLSQTRGRRDDERPLKNATEPPSSGLDMINSLPGKSSPGPLRVRFAGATAPLRRSAPCALYSIFPQTGQEAETAPRAVRA